MYTPEIEEQLDVYLINCQDYYYSDGLNHQSTSTDLQINRTVQALHRALRPKVRIGNSNPKQLTTVLASKPYTRQPPGEKERMIQTKKI